MAAEEKAARIEAEGLLQQEKESRHRAEAITAEQEKLRIAAVESRKASELKVTEL